MAINQFMNGGASGHGDTSEQDLVESNIIEIIQLSGHDIYYIPRNEVNLDNLLNENGLASFDGHFIVEMYLDTPDQFGGEGMILGPHGLEINNSIQWTVSRKRYKEETSKVEPVPGDLLYWPLTNTIWEIKKVNHEPAGMWQLKQLYVWQISANLFTYSYQDFNTGIKQVDDDLNSDVFETPFDDKETIIEEAEEVLDFTEENPFGEIIPRD